MARFIDKGLQLDDVQDAIASTNVTIVLCTAGWKKDSQRLLDEMKILMTDVTIISLNVDDGDQLEIAMELEMNDIPSANLYREGRLLVSLRGLDITADNLQLSISRVATVTSADSIRDVVASAYKRTLEGAQTCCVSVDSSLNSEKHNSDILHNNAL